MRNPEGKTKSAIELKQIELEKKETELKDQKDRLISIIYNKPEIVGLGEQITKIKNKNPTDSSINDLDKQRKMLIDKYMKDKKFVELGTQVTKLKDELDNLRQRGGRSKLKKSRRRNKKRRNTRKAISIR